MSREVISEEIRVLESAKLIRNYCSSNIRGCNNCIFYKNTSECPLSKREPEMWDLENIQ